MCSKNGKCSCKYIAPRVGLFFAVLFALCFGWYFIHPTQNEFMLVRMQAMYFWFSGMDLTSFVLGLIQSFILGVVVFGIWHMVVQGGCKKACSSGEKDCCKKDANMEKGDCCGGHK